GGAGFIGSHVVDALRAAGHEPVVLDALLPQAHGVTTPPWCAEYDLVVGDIGDPGVVARALDGVDAVCHQAAMVGHGVDPADGPWYAAHNDRATAVRLAGRYRPGVTRLVLASSVVVYGAGRHGWPLPGLVRR